MTMMAGALMLHLTISKDDYIYPIDINNYFLWSELNLERT